MKHRLLAALFLPTLLLGLLSPLMPASKAAAAAADYTFYTPNDPQTLKGLYNNGNYNGDKPDRDKTVVYVTGGVFGSNTVALQYNDPDTGCANPATFSGTCNSTNNFGSGNSFGSQGKNLNPYVYLGEYSCDTSSSGADFAPTADKFNSAIGSADTNDHYDIQFAVSIEVDSLFNSNGTLNSNVAMTWVGYTGINFYAAQVTGQAAAPPVQESSANLPSSCMPPAPFNKVTLDSTDTHGSDGVDVKQMIKVTSTAPKNVVSSGTGGSVGAGGSGQVPNTCDNGFSLAWILCSVISGTANLLVDLYTNIINPLLDQPQSSQLLDTTGHYYQVWSNFRVYGDIFLVIALLVVVFGESIGGGIIDAYTAKKILPRLLIAAILINLSIYAVAIALDITSILGHGIYSLFMIPFGGSTTVGLTGMDLSTSGVLGALAAGGFGLVTIAVTSGFVHFFFVTILGTSALILLTVLITLVLRIALIMGLIFVSPVAFALYVLPNTEQYFRKWWDLLFRALLVYPIVGAIFALANITSITLNHLNGAGGIPQVLGLIGLFAPLVLVPFAFRLSGGAIGAIHNAAHSRVGQPGLKGLANVRARRRQVLHERRTGGKDWLGSGRTGSLYRGVSTLGSRDSWSPTRRGRSRFAEFEQKSTNAAADKALEEGGDRAFSNDGASALLMQGMAAGQFIDEYQSRGLGTREEARRALSRAETATGLRAGSRGMMVAAQKYRTSMSKTAYEGERGMEQLQLDLMRLQDGGLISADDAAGWMKANRGRADFSSNGYGATRDFVTGRNGTTARDQITGAFKGADPRDIAGSHPLAIASMAEQARINFDGAITELNAARTSGDVTRIATAERNRSIASADVAGIYDVLGSVSPNKAQEFANTVFGREVRVRTNVGPGADVWEDATVRKLVEDDRTRNAGPNGEQTFLERRREYGSALAARGAANAQDLMQDPPA